MEESGAAQQVGNGGQEEDFGQEREGLEGGLGFDEAMLAAVSGELDFPWGFGDLLDGSLFEGM